MKLRIRQILQRLLLDLPLVLCGITHKELVRLSLRGALRIRVIQQILDAKQHLFDGDCRAPVLLLIKNA